MKYQQIGHERAVQQRNSYYRTFMVPNSTFWSHFIYEVICDQKVEYRTIKSSVVRISLLYLLNFPHCPKEKRLFLDCVPGLCAIQIRMLLLNLINVRRTFINFRFFFPNRTFLLGTVCLLNLSLGRKFGNCTFFCHATFL